MMALARVGERDHAAQLAARFRRDAEKKPYSLLTIACAYACCVESLTSGRKAPLSKEEQAEKERNIAAGMEALEAVEKLGYASPEAIATEEDLAGFFDVPAFKALVARMRAKAGDAIR